MNAYELQLKSVASFFKEIKFIQQECIKFIKKR